MDGGTCLGEKPLTTRGPRMLCEQQNRAVMPSAYTGPSLALAQIFPQIGRSPGSAFGANHHFGLKRFGGIPTIHTKAGALERPC